MPKGALRYDMFTKSVSRMPPEQPKRGKYSTAEDWVWLAEYYKFEDVDIITGKGWNTMAKAFLEAGFHRTNHCLSEHVSSTVL